MAAHSTALVTAPTVRIATGNRVAEVISLEPQPDGGHADPPALLVSFVWLRRFLRERHRYRYRDWVLDSGAFSAHNSGKEIRLAEYIEACRSLLGHDPTLTEVYSLDVIGDHHASRVNCDLMWEAGVPAVPTYHHGEPEAVLLDLARTYPKIALGGAVGLKPKYKMAWAAQCFARTWPKRIHGFGFGTFEMIVALPWHSVDASNWASGPCRYGNWKRYGRMSVRGSRQHLQEEVKYYLGIEQKARIRWQAQMRQLDTLPLERTP